jgi:hypothetical protein
MKMYSEENIIKVLKYSTYMGIKLENAEIVFIKRNILHLVTYLR